LKISALPKSIIIALRQGFAEVVLGKGKTRQQVRKCARHAAQEGLAHNIPGDRADKKIFAAVKRVGGKMRVTAVHELSGAITIERIQQITGKEQSSCLRRTRHTGSEEALLTARMMGNRAEYLYDVGVAGIHRLLEHREKLTQARVIICVAGMEGALPASSAAS